MNRQKTVDLGSGYIVKEIVYNKLVRDKIPEIIEAAGKLKRKDEMIEELTTTLADTQKAVYELQNCTSMKITAPLRKIMAFFKDDSKEKHE